MQENTNQKDFSSQWDSKKKYDNEENEEIETILVIDDELGPREALRFIFKDRYNVITADSGIKGIEVIKNRRVDIIILDLKMPGMNGIETLAEIRKYDENVPVIILTGYGDMETARKAMHYGAIEFISKPFEIIEIEEAVKNGIKRGKAKYEIEKLKKELNSLKEKLSKRFEEIENLAMVGEMSAEIVHEINNLLTIIYGYTQLLMQEINQQSITSKYANIIEKEIRKCKNITQNILELTKNKIEIEDVNLNELISNLVEFLQESKIAQNIEFSLKLTEEPIIIKCNFNHLHQAILNILINSVQSIKTSGSITIETKKEKDSVIIDIKDTGCGIPQEIIEKVKDPFFTTKEKGTGLGLHLTTKIVNKYGGTFDIKSKVGEGSEFIIKLPLS